jgi:hypothetical protein
MDNKLKTIDLNSIRVASPCSVPWESMAGDDRSRRCEQCSQSVFNISGLSKLQAEDLIRSREGRMCVRFYRRNDGTVLTNDCPVGLRAVRARMSRRATAALAAVLGLFSIGYGQKSDSKQEKDSKPKIVRTVNDHDVLITGTVMDSNGAVIPGAKVTLLFDKQVRGTASNDEGVFSFASLKPGMYDLRVKFAGFKEYRASAIRVEPNSTVDVSVEMKTDASMVVGLLEISPEILVDTTSSSVTTRITRRQIETLPH